MTKHANGCPDDLALLHEQARLDRPGPSSVLFLGESLRPLVQGLHAHAGGHFWLLTAGS